MMQHQSPYLAMSDNPVSFMDPTGGWDWFSWGDGEGLSPEEYERRWQRAQDRANRSGDNDPYDDWMSGWGFGEDASGNMRGELMDFWQWQENLAYFKNNSWEKDVNGNWTKDYYIRYRFDTKDGNTEFGVGLEIVRMETNAFQRAGNSSSRKTNKRNVQGGGGDWISFASRAIGTAGIYADGLAASYKADANQIFKYSERINGKVRSPEVLTRANRINSLNTAKTFSRIGTGLTVLSAGITIIDGIDKGWKNHHTADLAITGALYGTALAVPVVGWIAGGAYFLTDLAVQGYTGKSITQNLFD